MFYAEQKISHIVTPQHLYTKQDLVLHSNFQTLAHSALSATPLLVLLQTALVPLFNNLGATRHPRLFFTPPCLLNISSSGPVSA